MTRLLSRMDQSARRALRHGIQVGLLRPMLTSRSPGIAAFPSSQRAVVGGVDLLCTRPGAIHLASKLPRPTHSLTQYARSVLEDEAFRGFPHLPSRPRAGRGVDARRQFTDGSVRLNLATPHGLQRRVRDGRPNKRKHEPRSGQTTKKEPVSSNMASMADSPRR